MRTTFGGVDCIADIFLDRSVEVARTCSVETGGLEAAITAGVNAAAAADFKNSRLLILTSGKK